jgi:hypothetical protein
MRASSEPPRSRRSRELRVGRPAECGGVYVAFRCAPQERRRADVFWKPTVAAREAGASGSADTPGSVHRALARHRLDDHLSRSCVAAALQRPTRKRGGQPHGFLSGLAPDEVYRADRVTAAAGGLLPHRFTLTSDWRPRRSAFCGTVSRVAPGGRYPPSCPVEPGRSSASDRSDDAAVLPTHSPVQSTGRAW